VLFRSLKTQLDQQSLGDIKCYVWLDFGCINQDGNPAAELKQLDTILRYSDLLFTPIVDKEYDPDNSPPSGIGNNPFESYPASAWSHPQFGYANRGWCRVEMFYASNIPLGVFEKQNTFSSALMHTTKCSRRPHFLYGTREHLTGRSPFVLPPLQNSYFEKFHPAKGSLSVASDKTKIDELVNELQPFMTKPLEDGYTGQMSNGVRHGRGIFRAPDGTEYVGEFANGQINGKGIATKYDGSTIEGNFVNGKPEGHVFQVDTTECWQFEGEYKNGVKCGEGWLADADRNIFTGTFRDNLFVEGKVEYEDGRGEYNGECRKRKHHGKGRMNYANGDHYDGDWVDGKREGTGTMYYRASNMEYTGDWRDDQRHGKGVYGEICGEMKEYEWYHDCSDEADEDEAERRRVYDEAYSNDEGTSYW